MTRANKVLLLPVVLLSFGLVGCGGDDDDTASGDASGGDVTAYCEATVEIETIPEPDVDFDALSEEEQQAEAQKFAKESMRPIVDEIVATAPDEIGDDIETLDGAVKGIEESGDFSAFESDEVEAASDRVHTFDLENCGWGSDDVEGVDYAFTGVPSKVEAGVHSFEFTNEGEEVHMLGIMKKKSGTTESWEELLDLPEEEAEAKTEFLGETFAEPGDGEYLVVDLSPGEYLAVCFIPVGSTPEAGEDVDGPPHFTEGMFAEFTVS